MKIFRWGDDLGVRVPRKLIRELDLKDGDEVNLEIIGEKTFVISKILGRRKSPSLGSPAPQPLRRPVRR